MQRIAIAAVVALLAGFLSPSTRAQTPLAPATQKGFSFCTVHDVAGHKVWASPVFEYEYPSADGSSRTLEMATDFHNLIGSMGGAGDKVCALASSDRAAVEASRDEQRGILTARFMGVLAINKWMDVAWTPKPWTPALMAKPAVVSRHFYCYGTDTDQRATLASTVASPVFETSMDGADPMAPYTLAEQYGKEFTRYVVEVHGLTQANPSCHFKDTQAEAEKALRDYRKTFSGFNLKFADVAWRPTGEAIAPAGAVAPIMPPPATGSMPPPDPFAIPVPQARIGVRVTDVTPALAVALGLDRARGALVIEALQGTPAMAAGLKPMDVVLSINQQAVEQSTDLPVISGRLPAGMPALLRVWRERAEIELRVDIAGPPVAAAVQSGAAIAAKSEVSAVQAAAPPVAASASRKFCHAFIQFVGKPGGVRGKVWENSGSDGSQTEMTATLATFVVHMRQQQPERWNDFTASPIECDMNSGFCYANTPRHFGRSQLAGQFCKTTREEAETDWTRLTEVHREMEIIAWPAR